MNIKFLSKSSIDKLLKDLVIIVGIDTLQINVQGTIKDPCAPYWSKRPKQDPVKGITECIFNPDKFAGKPIRHRTEYNEAFKNMLIEQGIKEYTIHRIDIRFDGYKVSFDDMEKLMSFFVLLVGQSENLHNRWSACDKGRAKKGKSEKAVKKDEEIVFYNKKQQENKPIIEWIKDPIENRFECRFINPKKERDDFSIETQCLYNWIKIFKSAVSKENISLFQNINNKELIKEYESCFDKTKSQKAVRRFIDHYDDVIFTQSQLKDFISKTKAFKDPKSVAHRMVKNITVFQRYQFDALIKKYKDAIDYFQCGE